jgi:dienelactone hydrolase
MMVAMSRTEQFSIELKGGTLRGTLHRPKGAVGESVPAVLICRGVHVHNDDAAGLFDDLTESLLNENLAVMRFEHRCADLILEDFHVHCIGHDLEDAVAAAQWLTRRNGIDRHRIGVIGYALGAFAACGLCTRISDLAQLCLISPATPADLLNRMTRGNGTPAVLDPTRLPSSYLPSLSKADPLGELVRCSRPVLIVHGAGDRFVMPEVSQAYVEALQKTGSPVDRVLIARGDHIFSGPATRQACLDQVSRYFHALVETPMASATA